MLKSHHFWKRYRVYLIGIILILALVIIFKPLQSTKFYGFEYEDSFISTHVSAQKNLKPFTKDFRTQGCESKVNGECISVSSYTGHYISYSTYLFTVAKIFKIKNQYNIHKIGNALLFGLCFILIFVLYKDDFLSITLIFSLISCLPVVYVLNSGLIENLSFSVAFILMVSLHQYLKTECKWWLWITFFLLILLILIKRENLIYLSSLILINPKQLIKNKVFWIFTFCLIFSQYIINPFFTEELEASYLGKSTFSIDYLFFQLPTYLNSFIRLDGFLILIIFLIVSKKPSKYSFLLILIWFSFILLYSFHYRGQYAIELEKITHFESFRYMFNTLPLLIGYMLFGRNYNNLFKKITSTLILVACLFLIFDNFDMLKEFGREEYVEYHSVNQKIDSLNQTDERIAIHDNFVLISMLNSTNNQIDIYSAQNKHLELYKNRENILINRFNLIDLDVFREIYQFELMEKFSTERVKVYSFKEFPEKMN